MRQNLGFVLKKQDRENHDPNSIVDYYEVSLAMSLIDVVLSELLRGAKLYFQWFAYHSVYNAFFPKLEG